MSYPYASSGGTGKGDADDETALPYNTAAATTTAAAGDDAMATQVPQPPLIDMDLVTMAQLAEVALTSPDKAARDAAAQQLRFLGLYEYWNVTQGILVRSPSEYLRFIAAKATLFLVANELGADERADVACAIMSMLRSCRAQAVVLPRYIKTALYSIYAMAMFQNWRVVAFRCASTASSLQLDVCLDGGGGGGGERDSFASVYRLIGGCEGDGDGDSDSGSGSNAYGGRAAVVDIADLYAGVTPSHAALGGALMLRAVTRALDTADALDCVLELVVLFGQRVSTSEVQLLHYVYKQHLLPYYFCFAVLSLPTGGVRAAELCCAVLDAALPLPGSLTSIAHTVDANVCVYHWDVWSPAVVRAMTVCMQHLVAALSSSSQSRPGNNSSDDGDNAEWTRVLMRLLRLCSCIVCEESAFVPARDALATTLLDAAEVLLQLCEQHNERTDVLQLACALVVNTMQRHESVARQHMSAHIDVLHRWAAATSFVLARFADDEDELRRWLMLLFYLVADVMLPAPLVRHEVDGVQQLYGGGNSGNNYGGSGSTTTTPYRGAAAAASNNHGDAGGRLSACERHGRVHGSTGRVHGGDGGDSGSISSAAAAATAAAIAAAEAAGVTCMGRSYYDDGTTTMTTTTAAAAAAGGAAATRNNNNNEPANYSNDGGAAVASTSSSLSHAAAAVASEEAAMHATVRRIVTEVCMRYLHCVIAKAALREESREVRSANGVILHNERTLMPLSQLLFSNRLQLLPVVLDVLRETLTCYQMCVQTRVLHLTRQRREQATHNNNNNSSSSGDEALPPLDDKLLALVDAPAATAALRTRPPAAQLLYITGVCLSRLSVLISIFAIALVNGAIVRDDAVLELVADFAQQLLGGDDDDITDDLLQCLSFDDDDTDDNNADDNNSRNAGEDTTTAVMGGNGKPRRGGGGRHMPLSSSLSLSSRQQQGADQLQQYGDDDDDDDGAGAGGGGEGRRVHISMLRALFFFCGCVFESRAARQPVFARITLQLLRFVYLRHSDELVLLRDANRLLPSLCAQHVNTSELLGSPRLLAVLEAVRNNKLAILHLADDEDADAREAVDEFLSCMSAFIEMRYYAGYEVDDTLQVLLERTLYSRWLLAQPRLALRHVLAIARGCQQPDTLDVVFAAVFAHQSDFGVLMCSAPVYIPPLLTLLTQLCTAAQDAFDRGSFATLPWRLASLALQATTAYLAHISDTTTTATATQSSPHAQQHTVQTMRELSRAHELTYTTSAAPLVVSAQPGAGGGEGGGCTSSSSSRHDYGYGGYSNDGSYRGMLCATYHVGPRRLLRQLARRQCLVPLPVQCDVDNSNNNGGRGVGGCAEDKSNTAPGVLPYNSNNNNSSSKADDEADESVGMLDPLPRYYSFTSQRVAEAADDDGDEAVVFQACALLSHVCGGASTWCNMGVLLYYERDLVQRFVSGTVQLLTSTPVQVLVAREEQYTSTLRALLALLCGNSGAAMRWLHVLLLRQGLWQALMGLLAKLMSYAYRPELVQLLFVLVCQNATWRRTCVRYGGVDTYTLASVFHEVAVLFVVSGALRLSEMRQCVCVLELCYAAATPACMVRVKRLLEYSSAYHRVRLRTLFSMLHEGRHDVLETYMTMFGTQTNVHVLAPW